MKSFKTHDIKQVIRDQWCKPLIAQFGNKLCYLGLPAREALDISHWLPHINNIVAFQCADHRTDKIISWDDATELERKLLGLERTNDINFSLYKGFLEEVIIGGRDTVSGTPFTVNNIVNIYNLDFCNELTSPIKFYDQNNDKQTAFKMEAISKLLEIQRDLRLKGEKRFVMFITVHSGINEKSMEMHSTELSSGDYKSYHENLLKLGKLEKSIRQVKLSMFHFIRTHFCSRCFVPELLPPIYYQGTNGHRLLTFTILGDYEKTSSGTAPMYQTAAQFLNSKLITADGTGLKLHTATGIKETDISTDPLKHFQASSFVTRKSAGKTK